ncbi:sodium:solute symporter family transporter [Clostridium grantii]|uniref:Transporter, SSS family n=1 Tax=Clostridium grantii DSM 8605 TaxID=1121316 RepID=A0A1M5VVL5_9CLOT|nr:sodium/solute symporter [Clostridium grantii]SHH79034.1 transporter, SSS family [Clostridium grantii DSM 8605]
MISTIDGIIILVYILGMLAVGYFMGKDNETQEDYFLAGRSMPWLPIALSVAATMISANAFIGGPGWAYGSGLAPFMVNITVPLAIFFAFFASTPVIYQLKVTSVYQYMEYRLGPITRILTVLQFFINSLIQVSSMVFIPSLILQTITGWSLTVIVPLIVTAAIIYTITGGIKAVIWTDVIQTVIVWGGMFLAIFIALKRLDMGLFETLGQAKAAGKFHTLDFGFSLTNTNAFWASLIGGTVMWVRYFSFDQAQMQRVLTAKSMKGVKKSFLSSAFIMNIMYFLMLTVGLILWVFYGGKEFESSNQVMIGFILEEMPVGVVGLVIAGAFAAAMSSVDSILNSLTTVFIKDIYEKYFFKGKEGQSEASLKLTMTISAVFGVIIIFFVIIGFSGTVKSVLDVVGKYISYFSGPACGAFLLAMFTNKANDKGVATGFILGMIGTFFISTSLGTSWLWNPAIGAALSVAIGYIASMIFPATKKTEDIKQYTAQGMRAKLIAEGKTEEDGVSILPFSMDKYAIIALVFFVSQYILLALIQ